MLLAEKRFWGFEALNTEYWDASRAVLAPVTVFLCPVASKDRISVHDGTFTWSQESLPCLHGYEIPQRYVLGL